MEYLPYPYIRIWTLGTLRVEKIQPPFSSGGEPAYELIKAADWGGNPARTMLKHILVNATRSIPRSLLQQYIDALHLNTQAFTTNLSKLKTIFTCKLPQEQSLNLLETEHDVVQIKEQELVWIDIDAIQVLLTQANKAQQNGDDALVYLREAAQYCSHGQFLEDDQAPWLRGRRANVELLRRQVLHQLTDEYERRDMAEEALSSLLRFLERDFTNEDIHCRVMSILHCLNRTADALLLYDELESVLQQQNKTCTQFTRAVVSTICKGTIPQGQNIASKDVLAFVRRNVLPSQQFGFAFPGQMSQRQEDEAVLLQRNKSTFGMSFQECSEQFDVRFSHSLPQHNTLGSKRGYEPGRKDMDSKRRKMLQQTLHTTKAVSLLALSPSWSLDIIERLSQALTKPSSLDDTLLRDLDQRTTYYWQVRYETSLAPAVLLTYVEQHLRDITHLLESPLLPSTRIRLCSLASRTALLQGVLLYDQGQHEQARNFQTLAIQAAIEAEQPWLQAICWGWQSFTWYTKNYQQALVCIHQAQHAAALQSPDIVVQAWLGAIEAEIEAHLQHRKQCLTALDRTEQMLVIPPIQDSYYLFRLDFAQFYGYKGACLQQLYQKPKPATHDLLEHAKEALDQAIVSDAPDRRKLTYLCDLAGVFARKGEVEEACSYAMQSLTLINKLGLKNRKERFLQMRGLLQPYHTTAHVQALDKQYMFLLVADQQ